MGISAAVLIIAVIVAVVFKVGDNPSDPSTAAPQSPPTVAAQTTSLSDLNPNKFIENAFYTNIADGKCQFQEQRLACYYTGTTGRRQIDYRPYGTDNWVSDAPVNSNPERPKNLLPLPDGIYRHQGWTITVGAGDDGVRALKVCNLDNQCSSQMRE